MYSEMQKEALLTAVLCVERRSRGQPTDRDAINWARWLPKIAIAKYRLRLMSLSERTKTARRSASGHHAVDEVIGLSAGKFVTLRFPTLLTFPAYFHWEFLKKQSLHYMVKWNRRQTQFGI